MLPVVLLLALWFAVNVGGMAASMMRSPSRRRRQAPEPVRTPGDARTSTVRTSFHTP